MKISLINTSVSEISWILELESTAREEGFIRGDHTNQHRIQISASSTKYLTIVLAGKPVGFVILNDINSLDKNIELGRIIIGPRNAGIGQPAIKEILRYIFEDLEANRVSLDTLSHNNRAQHIYKKLGFVQEGLLRESLLLNNIFHDVILFGLLRRDWKKIKKRAVSNVVSI
ncbi:MAG: GNAT family N-acetyltransferase [Robiginitomaculum sp.]|nr:GNAT family N-acetyltransferase [Robiginitomaculum sp.]